MQRRCPISNRVKKMKNKGSSSAGNQLTLQDITTYCQSHAYTSSLSDDYAYCVEYDIKQEPKMQTIRAYFTTKTLTNLGDRDNSNVKVDGTFKVCKRRLPVIMTGQDDACNHFHPNGFAIVKHENHVDVAWALHCHKKSKTVNKAYPFRPTFTMADAGASMSSALQEVYSDVPRGTCYFHVLENVKSYFGAVSKDHDRFSIKNEFLDDVKFIHVAWTIPVKIKAI